MNINLIPIRVKRQQPSFDIFRVILGAIENNKELLIDGDILVISSKFVSMSENRIAQLSKVGVKKAGKELAKALNMDEKLAQLVVNEADTIFSGVPGFALAIKNEVIAPNAGIDRSNVFPGYAILYPKDPFLSAERIREGIFERTSKRIGIALSDSRLMPTRIGTTGVAIAVSGFEPVKDERGRKDLFGNTLRVTQRAIADDIASAAQLIMGEADEGIPVVIARGSGLPMTNKSVKRTSLSVSFKDCIYITGLTNGKMLEKMRRIKPRAS